MKQFDHLFSGQEWGKAIGAVGVHVGGLVSEGDWGKRKWDRMKMG